MGSNAKKLFTSLKKHWEPLFFIETESDALSNYTLATILAFWLAKPYVLCEIVDELQKKHPNSEIAICNAIYCLIELGAHEEAEKKLGNLSGRRFNLLRALLIQDDNFVALAKEQIDRSSERAIVALMKRELVTSESLYEQLQPLENLSEEGRLMIDSCRIWAALQQKDWSRAGEILHQYPFEQLSHETSPLFFLYGCWLLVTEGKEIATIHFSGILDVPYPSSWALAGHYLYGRISGPEWTEKAFLWEKRQLEQQLELYRSLEKEAHD